MSQDRSKRTFAVTVSTMPIDDDMLGTQAFEHIIRNRFDGTAIRVEDVRPITVILTSDVMHKIPAIKAIRTLTGFGLKDAKFIADYAQAHGTCDFGGITVTCVNNAPNDSSEFKVEKNT